MNAPLTTPHDPAAGDLERQREAIAALGHELRCSSTPPSAPRPPRKP
ncbi:hypothetical protein [Streptomyces sp. NPDC059874]